MHSNPARKRGSPLLVATWHKIQAEFCYIGTHFYENHAELYFRVNALAPQQEGRSSRCLETLGGGERTEMDQATHPNTLRRP
jgi:hypothetical protein